MRVGHTLVLLSKTNISVVLPWYQECELSMILDVQQKKYSYDHILPVNQILFKNSWYT